MTFYKWDKKIIICSGFLARKKIIPVYKFKNKSFPWLVFWEEKKLPRFYVSQSNRMAEGSHAHSNPNLLSFPVLMSAYVTCHHEWVRLFHDPVITALRCVNLWGFGVNASITPAVFVIRPLVYTFPDWAIRGEIGPSLFMRGSSNLETCVCKAVVFCSSLKF